MVPAASWLSRTGSQFVSGSHFCPGGKERLLRFSSGGSGAGGWGRSWEERITPWPGCSAEQAVATPGREILRGLDLEPDGRAQQAAHRLSEVPGAPWWGSQLFRRGTSSSLDREALSECELVAVAASCRTGLFSNLKVLESSSTVSNRDLPDYQ